MPAMRDCGEHEDMLWLVEKFYRCEIGGGEDRKTGPCQGRNPSRNPFPTLRAQADLPSFYLYRKLR